MDTETIEEKKADAKKGDKKEDKKDAKAGEKKPEDKKADGDKKDAKAGDKDKKPDEGKPGEKKDDKAGDKGGEKKDGMPDPDQKVVKEKDGVIVTTETTKTNIRAQIPGNPNTNMLNNIVN